MKKLISEVLGGDFCRIVAFGSSNTQRRVAGMHWFDCFDLGADKAFGRGHRCINSGVGGDTTVNLLSRFEQDVAFYKPSLVFVTIGGNDSSLDRSRGISSEEFADNLRVIHQKIAALGAGVVFQTYYAPDNREPNCEKYMERFEMNMQIVREVAQATGSGLVDHLALWEPFRDNCYEEYKTMMLDMLHVNYIGNMVMGLEIARLCGLALIDGEEDFWTVPLGIHRRMVEMAGC